MKGAVSLAVALAAMASVADVVTNEWIGANTAGKTASDIDIDADENWSLGHVPTAGECALVKFSSKQANLYIGESSSFAPDEWIMDFNNTDNNVYLDKSLTLTRFKLAAGSNTIYSGNKFRKRFFIGRSSSSQVTLKVTADGEPFDMRATSTSWASMGWSTNTVVELSGKNITFSKREFNTGTIVMKATDGGIGFDGANCPVGATISSIRFTDPSATVYMDHQNARRDGTIGPAYGEVHVCSTQTWNADPLAFVDFHDTYAGSNPVLVPVYFRSLDGGRLDNLSNVNIVVWHINNNAASDSTKARQLEPGTYGSVFNYGGTTSIRNSIVGLSGDVRLCGYAVYPGLDGKSAHQAEYSYAQDNVDGSSFHYLALNGHVLELDHGALFRCNDKRGALWLKDGTLISKGDICFYSNTHSATNDSPNSQYGIVGKNGRILLSGNFLNNLRSTSEGSLSTDTVEMIGGGSEQTWEVGDAATATGLKTKSSFSIGTFKVGVGTTNAVVRLVNESLNDNPKDLAEGDDVNSARFGEKLIVGALSVGPSSVLKVNGQTTEIVTGLAVDPTGVIDLLTGKTLAAGDSVTGFYGIGDQSADWDSVSAQVKDSSNPSLVFNAYYDSESNRTYFVANNGVTSGLMILFR